MALTFCDVLSAADMQLENTAVLLHNTTLQPLRRKLPWLADRKPDLFAAYQSVHSPQAEATLSSRGWVASFVALEGGNMLFVGFYRKASSRRLPVAEIYQDPRFQRLASDYGASDIAPDVNIARGGNQLLFEFELADQLRDLRGRMQIRPVPGRRYVRLAENLNAPIAAISPAPLFAPPCPGWRNMILTGSEVRDLPEDWARKLSEWRGIYLIVDQTDGARYVGSAYGRKNLLGRWREHAAREAGVTRELALRDPRQFRFSILERVSPDMPLDEIVTIERNWMHRLDTIERGLNT
ncbi:GIY-YIG nuclease family protein [Cribrihabitans neustonicus]|uniref:GIY-YIG nuclease family protein n=1 Tax=Cribrihabitans neustonicus TaxID=1429085 RepID=UPI003B59FFA8